jgi:hypothetical protein
MQLQITGTLVGMEARNGGWMAVGVQEPNSQYPKKLSTKKPELIQQAQSLMGQVVTAAYNESEGNQINPHTGTPYINRYLEALALGAVQMAQPQQAQPAPVQQQYAPQPQPQYAPAPVQQQAPQGGMSDAREMKIMRQAAAKVSVELLQHLEPGERTLASLVRISEQLVKYFDQGVPWQTNPIQAPQPQAQPQQDTSGYEGYPEAQGQGDDGIPF